MPNSRGTTQSPFSTGLGRTLHRHEEASRRAILAANERAAAMEAMISATARIDTLTATEPVPSPWDSVTTSPPPTSTVWQTLQSERPMRRAPREPSEVQVVRDMYRDTLRFQCEGDSSLLAEMERCYRILRELPAPRDRSPEQIDNLIIALTEDVATVRQNFSPESLEPQREERTTGMNLSF